jgi:dihydrofolate synthase/folylpolyglutamate synthase
MDRYLAKLYSRINYERQVRVGPRHFKLNNIRELLRRIDAPHLKYPVIHVAGTKGKGSVATMVAEILAASGRKTGLFTSPHLLRINERIVVGGKSISDQDFEAVLTSLEPFIQTMDKISEEIRHAPPTPDNEVCPVARKLAPITAKPLTFFEIITAAAMLHFANQNCDAVVLEVGLGGRLDSTNVCEPAATVITNISLDHTRQLGTTIDKIAFEKAGIIKPDVPVVSGALNPEADAVIQSVAKERNSPVFRLGQDFSITDQAARRFSFQGNFAASEKITIDDLRLTMLGQHQRTNAALAIATAETLNLNDWKISADSIRSGLLNANLQGRAQIVGDSPTVIMDVAHNVASITALTRTISNELPAWQTAPTKRLVFAVSKEKDNAGMLEILLREFDQIILTKYQDNPRGVAAESLLDLSEQIVSDKQLTDKEIILAENPTAAWRQVREAATEDDIICITGSVFLVAELLETVRRDAAGRS